MSWSSIAKKNCPAKPPTAPIKIQQKEVKNDYWNDPKYDCGFKSVETQIKKSYKKLGLEVPKTIYGRPGLLDFTK
jgi:hypothetical protein